MMGGDDLEQGLCSKLQNIQSIILVQHYSLSSWTPE
jgi:hypothetical protein